MYGIWCKKSDKQAPSLNSWNRLDKSRSNYMYRKKVFYAFILCIGGGEGGGHISLFLIVLKVYFKLYVDTSWSWSYGSWIYNYLCNQCLSPLTWVRIPLRWGVLDTTLCDKVCQWLVAVWWFSTDTLVSSTNETDHHDMTEILLKVALNNHEPNQT